MAKQVTLDYTPQPRQKLLHETAARFILYGGAAGGGKSVALRWDLIGWCMSVPGIQCYLYRRTRAELEENHIAKLKQEIPPFLGQWNERRNTFDFANGSSIHCWYCEREDDVLRAQGMEIHVLGIDEAAQLSPYQIHYLVTRVRLGSFGERVPEKYRHLLPRIVLTSNPGGKGHGFLKERFVDPAAPETIFADPDLKMPAIYIPATIRDNKYIDAGYENQFDGLPDALARALRDGDWDEVVGQALPITRERHMLRPFVPPRHATRIMGLDWGTAKPFSIGWYAVSDGWWLESRDNWPRRYIPPGALVRYAEWYGWDGRNRDHGCRLDSMTVSKRFLEMEKERGEPPIDYRVADSQCWARHDGPSIVERMMEATAVDGEPIISFRQSAKDREANYREFCNRLADQEWDVDGTTVEEPTFFVTANCTQFWQTVPSLTLDTNDPEKGWDSRLEDHVADEVAYVMASRPYVTSARRRADIDYLAAVREAGIVSPRGRGRYVTR